MIYANLWMKWWLGHFTCKKCWKNLFLVYINLNHLGWDLTVMWRSLARDSKVSGGCLGDPSLVTLWNRALDKPVWWRQSSHIVKGETAKFTQGRCIYGCAKIIAKTPLQHPLSRDKNGSFFIQLGLGLPNAGHLPIPLECSYLSKKMLRSNSSSTLGTKTKIWALEVEKLCFELCFPQRLLF